MAKLPTASADDGLGTGKFDFQVDLIGSHEYSREGRAHAPPPASSSAASRMATT